MYTNKKNILQLVSLLMSYGIEHVVVSPGSRNAPIIHTLAEHPYFQCFTVVDERSAAFFAIGMIQKLQRPVAICCTSGTSLLNYGSGVAEAFYQHYPLLVISADRPQAWIGQMDGQTLPQPGIFNTLVNKSVQLPEINTSEEEWYCNRLINEALISLTGQKKGPVHINIPLSEPLFQFTTPQIPEVRKINYYPKDCTYTYTGLESDWNKYTKRLIIVGQSSLPGPARALLQKLAQQQNCIILAEHTGNLPYEEIIHNFDTLLYTLSPEEKKEMTPELLITTGGHIVSKRIKQFLRDNPPESHWHIDENGGIPDTFCTLTHVLEENIRGGFGRFLEKEFMAKYKKYKMRSTPPPTQVTITPLPFHSLWKEKSDRLQKQIEKEIQKTPFSDITVMNQILINLPKDSVLHLANSSPVRNAQLFTLNKKGIDVHCNRGVSGIDGSLSTAVGYAGVHQGPVFLVIGDLSYLYDSNILFNKPLPENLRILLINNNGGEIFRLLPGLNQSGQLESFISQSNPDRFLPAGKSWKVSSSTNITEKEVYNRIKKFITSAPDLKNTPDSLTEPEKYSQILHIDTSETDNAKIFKEFYHKLKNTRK